MLEKYTSKLDDARKKAIERGLAEATGAPSPSAAVSGARPAGGFPSAAISAAAASSSPVRASSARISASSLVAQANKGAGKPAAAARGVSASTASKASKPGSGTTASAGGKKAAPGAAGGKGSGMARPSLFSVLWPVCSFQNSIRLSIMELHIITSLFAGYLLHQMLTMSPGLCPRMYCCPALRSYSGRRPSRSFRVTTGRCVFDRVLTGREIP